MKTFKLKVDRNAAGFMTLVSPMWLICEDVLDRLTPGSKGIDRTGVFDLKLQLSAKPFEDAHCIRIMRIADDIPKYRWFTYKPTLTEKYRFGHDRIEDVDRTLFPDMSEALAELGCVDKVYVLIT